MFLKFQTRFRTLHRNICTCRASREKIQTFVMQFKPKLYRLSLLTIWSVQPLLRSNNLGCSQLFDSRKDARSISRVYIHETWHRDITVSPDNHIIITISNYIITVNGFYDNNKIYFGFHRNNFVFRILFYYLHANILYIWH